MRFYVFNPSVRKSANTNKAEVKTCRFSHVHEDDFIWCCRDSKNPHPAQPINPSSVLEGGGRSLRPTTRVRSCLWIPPDNPSYKSGELYQTFRWPITGSALLLHFRILAFFFFILQRGSDHKRQLRCCYYINSGILWRRWNPHLHLDAKHRDLKANWFQQL